MIKLKRVYDSIEPNDGLRILVDRVWPRGFKKESLKLFLWAKDVAPSTALRKFFSHQESRWDEFKRLYMDELKDNKELEYIKELSKQNDITLLYAAKKSHISHVLVLLSLLER